MSAECQRIADCIAAGNHERAKADAALWQSLPLVGEMLGLELRNCECGSTLAIEVVK